MNQILLQQVNYDNKDFVHLCNELDSFLDIAIGGESKREKYKKYNYLDTMDYVIIAYDNEEAVGCAALRKYSDTYIEVKRVFVRENYRGQNVGGLLLEQLISHAKKTVTGVLYLKPAIFCRPLSVYIPDTDLSR